MNNSPRQLDSHDSPEWRDWCELIEETMKLRRLLGLKPWDPMEWDELDNPHPPGTVDHVAFEKVRERGLALDQRKANLRPYLDRKRERIRDVNIGLAKKASNLEEP